MAAEPAAARACSLPDERVRDDWPVRPRPGGPCALVARQDDWSEDEPAQSDYCADSAGYLWARARDLSLGDCSAPELQVDDCFPLAELGGLFALAGLGGLSPGDCSAVAAPAVAPSADSVVPE